MNLCFENAYALFQNDLKEINRLESFEFFSKNYIFHFLAICIYLPYL